MFQQMDEYEAANSQEKYRSVFQAEKTNKLKIVMPLL